MHYSNFKSGDKYWKTDAIVMLTLTSLNDINGPTRSALVVETKYLLVTHLNNKNKACKQWCLLYTGVESRF